MLHEWSDVFVSGYCISEKKFFHRLPATIATVRLSDRRLKVWPARDISDCKLWFDLAHCRIEPRGSKYASNDRRTNRDSEKATPLQLVRTANRTRRKAPRLRGLHGRVRDDRAAAQRVLPGHGGRVRARRRLVRVGAGRLQARLYLRTRRLWPWTVHNMFRALSRKKVT